MLLLTAGCLLSGLGLAVQGRVASAADLTQPMGEGRSAAWYAARTEAAIGAGALDEALAAARAAVAADPGDASAHERLAYLSVAKGGAVTREAAGALLGAYAAEPFPPAARMAWRVDLAGAHWASVPDPLIRATLSQVAALGGVPGAWETRSAWCQDHPVAAIGEAACATVPGIDRRWDLRREGRPGDPRVTGSRSGASRDSRSAAPADRDDPRAP